MRWAAGESRAAAGTLLRALRYGGSGLRRAQPGQLVQLISFVFSVKVACAGRRARAGRLRAPSFARCATEGPGCAERNQDSWYNLSPLFSALRSHEPGGGREQGGCGHPPSRVALRRVLVAQSATRTVGTTYLLCFQR